MAKGVFSSLQGCLQFLYRVEGYPYRRDGYGQGCEGYLKALVEFEGCLKTV